MDILKRIKSRLVQTLDMSDQDNINFEKNINSEGLIARERALFGAEYLQQQKLFEKWVTRDSWLLKSEAIPLLHGLDPDSGINNKEDIDKITDLWIHARQCVDQGLLIVVDKTVDSEKWEVHPQEVYKWAKISRVAVPEHFSSLMQFISAVINKPDESGIGKNTDQNIELNDDKERILGAALAILAAHPDQCRNKNGKVNITELLEILDQKGKFWFGERTPGLSKSARKDLISLWLNTIN